MSHAGHATGNEAISGQDSLDSPIRLAGDLDGNPNDIIKPSPEEKTSPASRSSMRSKGGGWGSYTRHCN